MFSQSEHNKALSLKEEGNKQFSTGNYQAAIGFYLQGIAVKPLPELWFNLGIANEKLGQQPEKALEAYGRALFIRPNYQKAQCGFERMQKIVAAKDVNLSAMFKAFLARVEEKKLQPRPSGKEITILNFPLPSHLYLDGKKTILSEAEQIIGKKFCNSLTIDEAYFPIYKKYCHAETVFQVFATQLEHPDPLPTDFFDIRSMGKFGYGLFLRAPVRVGTVLTYYLGKITFESGSDYGLGFGQRLAQSNTNLGVDLDPGIFTLGGLMQHLPDENDLDDPTVRFPKDSKVATENVHRCSVHLVAKNGPLCSLIVTPLVAQRDLKAGEIIGFSYSNGYWESRNMKLAGPAYFDPFGKVIELAAISDVTSICPERKHYSLEVLPRSLGEKTFQMLAEEAAPQLQGYPKIEAAQAHIRKLLAFDQQFLEKLRLSAAPTFWHARCDHPSHTTTCWIGKHVATRKEAENELAKSEHAAHSGPNGGRVTPTN